MERVYIIATGMAVANTEVSNEALCDMFPTLATSNEWLIKNVGVKKRYLADGYETLVDLLQKAAEEAIKKSGIKKIDRIIVGSNTQQWQYPATASKVANRIKSICDLSSCWCLDIQNGCPSGMSAIALGVDSIRTGQAENVLALGGDLTSRMVDWFDRNTCLLLGDGASAAVLTKEKNADSGSVSLEVLSHWEQTDFESADIMHMASGLSDYSPFDLSRKTQGAANEAVRRIFGQDKIPSGISEEKSTELLKATLELKKKAFPPTGKLPYKADRNPHFVMAGAEVLEKIRRIVPDCGYLPVLRNAEVGIDIFEKYNLLDVNRVSDIPSDIRKEFLKRISEEFNLLIPHQANLRGHQNLSTALRIPITKVYSNIADYANTSAASAGIALYEALLKPSRYNTIRGNLKEIEVPMFDIGNKAVMVSFGSGTHVVFMVLNRFK